MFIFKHLSKEGSHQKFIIENTSLVHNHEGGLIESLPHFSHIDK